MSDPQSVSTTTMRPPGLVMRIGLGEEAVEVADVLDDALDPDPVAVRGRQPGVASVAGDQLDADVGGLGAGAALVEHRLAGVDADGDTVGPDDACHADQLRAGTAPDVADHIARDRRELGGCGGADPFQRRQALPVVEGGDEALTDHFAPLLLGERRAAQVVAWLDGVHLDGLVEALEGDGTKGCEPGRGL